MYLIGMTIQSTKEMVVGATKKLLNISRPEPEIFTANSRSMLTIMNQLRYTIE